MSAQVRYLPTKASLWHRRGAGEHLPQADRLQLLQLSLLLQQSLSDHQFDSIFSAAMAFMLPSLQKLWLHATVKEIQTLQEWICIPDPAPMPIAARGCGLYISPFFPFALVVLGIVLTLWTVPLLFLHIFRFYVWLKKKYMYKIALGTVDFTWFVFLIFFRDTFTQSFSNVWILPKPSTGK